LGLLWHTELVAAYKESKQAHYRMADEAAIAVIDTLFDLYCNEPDR